MDKKFNVTAEAGLHARPATMLVNTASKFSSELFLEYQGRKVNLKSIMGVMSLGIRQGSQFSIIADGEDADQALEAIDKVLKEQGVCK